MQQPPEPTTFGQKYTVQLNREHMQRKAQMQHAYLLSDCHPPHPALVAAGAGEHNFTMGPFRHESTSARRARERGLRKRQLRGVPPPIVTTFSRALAAAANALQETAGSSDGMVKLRRIVRAVATESSAPNGGGGGGGEEVAFDEAAFGELVNGRLHLGLKTAEVSAVFRWLASAPLQRPPQQQRGSGGAQATPRVTAAELLQLAHASQSLSSPWAEISAR